MTRDPLYLTPIELRKFREIFTVEQMVDRLRGNQSKEFERFVGYLYQENGYEVFTTGGGADGGIDLIVERNGRRKAVQCKRYDPKGSRIGVPVLQRLESAMRDVDAQHAAVVTTTQFSRNCNEWNQNRAFDLIDGEGLEQRVQGVNSKHIQVIRSNSRRRSQTQRKAFGGMLPIPRFTPINALLSVLALLFGCSIGFFLLRSIMGIFAPQADLGFTTASMAPTVEIILIPEMTAVPTGSYPVATATNVPPPTSTASPTAIATANAAATATPIPPTPSPTVAPNTVSAKRMTTPPTIDGKLDEWDGYFATYSDAVLHCTEGVDPAKDVDIVWFMGWDDENLYVAANIDDDSFYPYAQPGQAHLGDSIELWIGPADRTGVGQTFSLRDSVITIAPEYLDAAYHYGRHTAAASTSAVVDSMSINMDSKSQIYEQSKQPYSNFLYHIESKIPWATLNLNPDDQPFLLSLVGTDNDASFPTAEIVYGNVADSVVENPTSWGSLRLIEK